jgi:DNA-binding MarR family transcriptional regulator
MEQLEILRILGETPGATQAVRELARLAQIQESAIAGHLTAMEQRGLLKTQTVDASAVCCYAPRTPEIGQLVQRLLQFYNERPVTLIRLVYARTDPRLKAFADSFRLRKEN